MRGQKSRESRLTILVGCRRQPRQGKSWIGFKTACQRSQHRRGEEQKGDGGRDRIAGQPEEAHRAIFVLVGTRVPDRQFPKDQRLAGLDAYAGEMEARTGACQSRLD